MKKTILFIFFFFIFHFFSYAQIEKSFWMLGGEARFSSFHSSQEGGYDNPRGNGFAISPNIGYFINDNLAIGAKIDLLVTNGGTGIGGGPFLRYYFLDNKKILNFFLEGRAGYGYAFPKTSNDRYTSYSYGFKGGPVIFLNENIGLELVCDYSIGKAIQEKINTDNFYTTIGLQIHLKNYNKKH